MDIERIQYRTHIHHRCDARAELAVFLGLTFVQSAFWYWLISTSGGLAQGNRYVIALMWSPAIGALTTTLAFHRTVRGQGWRWPGLRWAALAYALPVAYSFAAYGAVWLFGLGGVDLARAPDEVFRFVVLGTLHALLLAIGEEIGWRGYLVPVLARTMPFGRVAVVSGAVWAIWHAPLIVFADYHSGAPTWYSVSCFTISVVAISVPMAWLRLRSNSVWPAALMHASHNLYLQGFLDRVTVNTGVTDWFTGEFGVAITITTCATAWLFWRARTTVKASDGSRADANAESAGTTWKKQSSPM